MNSLPAPTLSAPSTATQDQIQDSVAALADRAAGSGRDVAAGLLQGVLRQLRASGHVGG